jgi:hypothetical protein
VKPTQPIISEKQSYKDREERRDRIKLAIEMLTFIAVVIYAGLTYRLLKTNQAQVGAMNGANSIAKQNSQADLRAYVTLGDKDGQWIKRNKHQVTLLFHNAGRTPAKHFSARYTIGQAGAKQSSHTDIVHMERTQIVSGFGAGGIISGGGNEIDSGETLNWLDAKPDVDFFKIWSMTGYFEYCDIFGKWHCEPFGGHFDPKHGLQRTDFPAPFFCDPNGSSYIEQIRKEEGPEAAKQYKALDRCEQGD